LFLINTIIFTTIVISFLKIKFREFKKGAKFYKITFVHDLLRK